MNKAAPVLKSDKLILKELRSCDITQKYIDWLNDSEVNMYLESKYIDHDKNKVKDFVNNCWNNESEFLFGIFLKEGMKHIGNIRLGPINKHHKRADIGLIIGDKSCWGKGVAKESIFLISQFGFGQLNLAKLTAGCYESNIGSKKAFEKSGYCVEGFLKDHVVLGDTREGVWKLGCLSTNFKR